MNLAALLGQANIQNPKEAAKLAADKGNALHGHVNAGGDPQVFMQELMAAQAEAVEIKNLKQEQLKAEGEVANLTKSLEGQENLEAKLQGILGKSDKKTKPVNELLDNKSEATIKNELGKSIQSPHVNLESMLGEKPINKKVVKVGAGAAPLVEAMEEQAPRKSLFMSKEKLEKRAKLLPTTDKAKNIQTLLRQNLAKGEGVQQILNGPEVASRAHVPQRKSIFSTNKGKQSAGVQLGINKENNPVIDQLQGLKQENVLPFNKKASINQFSKMAQVNSDKMFEPSFDTTAIQAETFAESPVAGVKYNEQSFMMKPVVQNNQQIGTTTTTSQVFEMSSMPMTGNTEQVIEQISNYITQKSFEGQREIELVARHKDLGEFMVRAAKGQQQDSVHIQVTAMNRETAEFFKVNQGKLLTTLANNGVNVSDFKLDSSQMNQDFSNQNFSQNQQGQQGSQSQAKQDSQRRQQLWKQFSQYADGRSA